MDGIMRLGSGNQKKSGNRHSVFSSLRIFLMWAGIVCGYVASSAVGGAIKTRDEAYQYCVDQSHTFIAIVFPIAQGHDDELVGILSRYGAIKYRCSVLLTKEDAYYLLTTSHTNVPSFMMGAHVSWYFPKWCWKKPARIFLMKFGNAQIAVECKKEIRDLFDLSYRSIHCTDTHKEAIELARFFFIKKRDIEDFVIDERVMDDGASSASWDKEELLRPGDLPER